MSTQPEALRLADILEHPSGPLAVEKATVAELRRLHRVELAFQVWSKKTEWVQGTGDGSELGMHIADVLKQRIERLQLSNTELLKELKRLVRLIEVEDAHLANFGEVEAARAVIAKQPEK